MGMGRRRRDNYRPPLFRAQVNPYFHLKRANPFNTDFHFKNMYIIHKISHPTSEITQSHSPYLLYIKPVILYMYISMFVVRV
jgi:hypothetical protein